MLTYTFSTREKVMLGVLGVVAVAILWYQFVFKSVQDQVAAIDAQIATAQEQLTMYQTRSAMLETMRTEVESFQSQGVQPVTLPSFDNTQNLMAYLNGVLSGTRGYSMSFDNPALSEEDQTIHRTGTITFTTGSYAEARSVIQSIARGPYPCQIKALGINDGSSSSGGTTSTNLQLTFFENPTAAANSTVQKTSDTPEGQDLTALTNWNK